MSRLVGHPGPRWLFAGLALAWQVTAAEGDVTELPELVVRATVPVADAVPGTASRLAVLPGLALSPQGVGAQTDISIRGSSFSGAGLAIGGLALRNAQTEHFHAEFPLAPQLFGPARLLTAAEQAEGSSGHLVGTVDHEFAPVSPGGSLAAGVGDRSRDWQSVFWEDCGPAGGPGWQTGYSLFGSRENAAGADYADNDLERESLGGRVQMRGGESQTDLAVGHQTKEFGARGYYGAPARFAAAESLRDTLVTGTSRWGDLGGDYLRLAAAWRRTHDQYWLDREHPRLYENQHTADLATAAVDGATAIADPLWLPWRVEAEEERLHSEYRGTLSGAGLGDHSRTRAGLVLAPELRLTDLTVGAGLKAQAFSRDRPAWLPLARLEYRPAAGHRLFVSAAEAVRQPSYTELNYDSPGSLGNQGLERQHDSTVEAGYHGEGAAGWRWEATGFGRQSRHTVDWTRAAPAGRWQATDLGTVDTWGVEACLGHPVGERADVGLAYAWLDTATDADPYASRYALDHPQHRLRLEAAWRPWPWCELRTVQAWRRQAPNPVRDGGRYGVDGTLEVRFALPRPAGTHVVLACENLWDDDFQPLPGQLPARRRGSLACTYAW